MKKLITAIALIPIIGLALMPGIWDGVIPMTTSRLWLWLVIIFGFLGLWTCVLKINPFIKAFAVLGFLNTFFSSAPYFSQIAYIELILCIYLYVLCLHIEDWKIVFNSLWCVLGINIILFIMQCFHKDNLLNFGLKNNVCSFGVGNLMQAKSFLICLFALLLQDNRLRFSKAIREIIFVVLPVFCVIYFFVHRVGPNFMYARGPAWCESIRLSLNRPVMGYGLGSFKILFPILGKGIFTLEGSWLNAHNFFVQIFFEMGIAGLITSILYGLNLLYKCFENNRLLLALGLIVYTLFVHFPDRSCQTVPLLILFLALIERTYNGCLTK
jgi:hypothetical protein